LKANKELFLSKLQPVSVGKQSKHKMKRKFSKSLSNKEKKAGFTVNGLTNANVVLTRGQYI